MRWSPLRWLILGVVSLSADKWPLFCTSGGQPILSIWIDQWCNLYFVYTNPQVWFFLCDHVQGSSLSNILLVIVNLSFSTMQTSQRITSLQWQQAFIYLFIISQERSVRKVCTIQWLKKVLCKQQCIHHNTPTKFAKDLFSRLDAEDCSDAMLYPT